jgi:hypothetical protein
MKQSQNPVFARAGQGIVGGDGQKLPFRMFSPPVFEHQKYLKANPDRRNQL